MRLSVLNTRLLFLRSTDAKTEVIGDRLSSTVVSILPLILSPCHLSHFSFECLLSFWLSYTRTYTYIFISLTYSFTDSSPSSFHMFARSLTLSCTRTRLSIFCSLLHISLSFYSRRSRYLVWSVLPTRFLVLS